MNSEQRIVTLERALADAQRELAELKAGNPPPVPPAPQPLRDEGVRIVQVLDERSDLPNLREMQRLFSAVKHRAPWPLSDKYDPDRPFRGFAACFRWLANKGRTEFPNPKFALGFWLDNCKTWPRARNSIVGDIDASTMILAVYASGDIAYVPANPTLGHTWELGLGEHTGRRASPDAWRRILREGAAAILPPSAPARRFAPPSPVRVIVGSRW